MAAAGSRRGKRARFLDADTDSESTHQFPPGLLNVPDSYHSSPTKATKKVTLPREKRPHVQRRNLSKAVHPGNAVGGDIVAEDGSDFTAAIDYPVETDATGLRISEECLEAYIDGVNSHTVGFYHLERNLFVVQGYSIQKKETRVSLALMASFCS